MPKKLFLVLIGVLLSGALAYTQVNATGVLLGTVTDKTGAVVPNASVKITEKETGAAREVKSSGGGQYRFDLLPAGTYTVSVTMPGFATAVFENVGVAVSQNTTVDVSLAPSTQQQVITVEATGTPLVDIDRSDVSLPISTKQLEDLPINGRDFVNLATLAPGARPVNSYDPTKNRYGVISVDGSNGRNSNVTVNGIDDKDNTVGGPVMQLPLEAVQEFVISTQRFSAANGRSEGFLITAITKSGSNQFHGSLYLFDRNQAMNANGFFNAGQTKPDYGRQQFGGSIGGPVRKDKDFLFFAIERERESVGLSVSPTFYNELLIAKNAGLAAQPVQTIPQPYFDWRYNGRWDHRFSDKHSMFASYTAQNNNGLNDQSSNNNDLTAGNFTTNHLILASVNFNSVLTPTIVNSATVGYQYWNNLIDSTLKLPTVNFASGEYFGTNGNVPQQSFQKKWQFKDDISITRGRHNFKTGIDFLNEPTLGGFFEFTPTPNVTFAADPSQIIGNPAYPQGFATPGLITNISETAGNPYFDLSVKMLGLYFQDDWKVNRRLSLNLGVRWDRDFNLVAGSAQGQSRAFQLLQAIHNPYAGIPHDDNKDFSPRIGLAYDLTGNGKHIVRGGFGLYYGQIFENITLFMIQQANPTVFATTLNLNSAGVGDTTADIVPTTGKPLSQFRYGVDPLPIPPPPPTNLPAGSTARLIDPSFRNPYTEQFNGGYTWLLSDANVIEVDYVHVLGLHAAKSIQLNPKDPNLGGNRILASTFAAAGITAAPASVQVYTSIDRSRYDALNIAYRRRLTRHMSMNASYVLSRGVGYNGSAASFGNTPTDLSNWFAKHDFGPVPNNETHRFVLSGILELPWGIRFAPILQAASARPYTAREGTDYFGNGNSSTAENAVVLNSDMTNLTATKAYSAAQIRSCLAANTCSITAFDSQRGKPFFELDTRFSKVFRFKERMNLEFFFQAFDLTNRANFGNSYGTNIRTATFGTPTNYFAPSAVLVPIAFEGEAGFTFRF